MPSSSSWSTSAAKATLESPRASTASELSILMVSKMNNECQGDLIKDAKICEILPVSVCGNLDRMEKGKGEENKEKWCA